MEEQTNLEPTAPAVEAMPEETSQTATNPQDEIKALVEKYTPGIDMSSQETIDAAVLSLLQNLDRVQTKLMVAVENDPDLGAALAEIMNGGKARVALARAYGPDAFSAVEGDPDYEEMTKGYQEGTEKLKKKAELASTIAKNQEMSIKEITAWMEEKGYDDAAIKARLAKMDEIRQDFLNDKITKAHLQLIDKAMDFDSAVANAEEAGKVAGRNEQIVEKREKMKVASDGLHGLTSQNKKPSKPESFTDKFMKDL